jgi:hypothetical protein
MNNRELYEQGVQIRQFFGFWGNCLLLSVFLIRDVAHILGILFLPVKARYVTILTQKWVGQNFWSQTHPVTLLMNRVQGRHLVTEITTYFESLNFLFFFFSFSCRTSRQTGETIHSDWRLGSRVPRWVCEKIAQNVALHIYVKNYRSLFPWEKK